MQQNQSLIKGLQKGIREWPTRHTSEVIKVEAHLIPEHPRPRRWWAAWPLWAMKRATSPRAPVKVLLRPRAAGCVPKRSWRSPTTARPFPPRSRSSRPIPNAGTASTAPPRVLDILQRIFYRNDAAREAFVEMCDDKDVQKLTFDSYLYKRVVMMNPWQQIKLTLRTLQPDPG